jgi:hypothetical protein
MEHNADNQHITVNIKAIENGMLILESKEDGQQIRWPLSKLPSSVNVGDCLSVRLQSNTDNTETALPSISQSSTEADQNSNRQKLLEELIN